MAVPLPAGQYLVHDLIGLPVVTVAGRDLGRIIDVQRTGANDVYVTERALIPATKAAVREIDLEGGRVVVEDLEGLTWAADED
jgi:16S rRNA processing protein RimM